MTTPEILPCPWCAGAAKLSPGLSWATHYWVNCPSPKCRVIGPHADSKKDAIAAWNRVAAMPGLLEIAAVPGLLETVHRSLEMGAGMGKAIAEIAELAKNGGVTWSTEEHDLTSNPNPKEKE